MASSEASPPGIVASGGEAVVAQPRPRATAFLEQDKFLGIVLLAPALILLAIFVAYPFIYGIWLSMTDTYVGQPGKFVGLQNFADQFQDGIFRKTVTNTFEYTFVTIIFKFVLGLALAVTLNQRFRAKRFVRAAVLLPWIVPTALSTLTWMWMFDSTFSVFNWILRLVRIQGPIWLGEGHWPMISLMIANIWRGAPFYGITFLAGMQTISEELYEAATMDGASAWQKFRNITFPLLTPITTIVTLLSIILTFSDFQLIYILTRGGPANSTNVFGTWAYYIGIPGGQLGTGAAVSLTMFPVLAIVIFLTLVALRRD